MRSGEDRVGALKSLPARRLFLRQLFDAAVAASDPMRVIPKALPARPAGRVIVIGAGKASARMAEAVEARWGPCEGLVITRDGYGRYLQGVEVAEAAHPVPDVRGLEATRRMFDLLDQCGEEDFVLALISGGGSSLLTWPAGDVTLEEERAMTQALLASGAPITAMNALRKHLSRAKGGNLAAAAWPARMLSLIVSDVPGDDPAMIASGPTVIDDTTQREAREIARRWNIPLSPSMQAVLDGHSTTVSKGDIRISRTENRIVAAPALSLQAAADLARFAGVSVRILGDAIEGEARDVAADHAKIALEAQAGLAVDEVTLLLSGGECTVTQRGRGIGGPNAEYCLALSCALDGVAGIAAIACDTDGVDGAAEVAGALIDETTLQRATSAGLSAQAFLDDNDSHSFFRRLGDQIAPGPTLTNVNDFRAMLIFGKSA
ncbi:glycerate kinase [Paracoccus sp. R12_1]|uniref:glycerate kinase type-2 family protein n=1 Tax=unclassified Paracoccus (in: a-proteobacteria) TaxID=2688777 RepID=UPI001ADD535E|nr:MULTISPECIES: glycerate kinase [unclassified Paracoccus (in: a-proteobacteria)]MBO9457028.1 glycerate kinase [Paracoccus sp. R12_2]MBO9488087.1 glycerate kinase [Paracoccus sp. R12_1]